MTNSIEGTSLANDTSPFEDNAMSSSIAFDWLAEKLFYSASFLTAPICYLHRHYIHLISPFHLLKYGQCSTKTKEIALRSLFGLELFLFSIPALSASICGMVMRYLANVLRKNDFFYVKGNGIEKNIPENRTFSLLSFNTCCIAGGFPLVYGGVLPWNYRLNSIANQIKENDPDIICLQEMHDLEACYALIDELKEYYPHFVMNIGPQNLGANSGLFIASKYKIDRLSFCPYDKNNKLNEAKFVKKGIFGFQIQDGEKTIAKIYTTHLQHSQNDFAPTKKEEDHRRLQMEKCLIHIKEQYEEGIPVLICGDFNLSREEYTNTIFDQYFYNDLLTRNKIKSTACRDFSTHYYWRKTQKKPSAYEQKLILDHILLLNYDPKTEKPLPSLTSIEIKKVSAFDFSNPASSLSDHHGLIANITLPA